MLQSEDVELIASAMVPELLAYIDQRMALRDTAHADELTRIRAEHADQIRSMETELASLRERLDGKVAELDVDAVAQRVVKLMPEPQPGRDADPEEVARIVAETTSRQVAEQVAKAAAEMRQPEDGRDALALEVLPGIDETKSYARGTYATHRGGLWRTFEKSHGLRGWECLVDGLAGVVIEQEGAKGFRMVVERSSGQVVEKEFTVPAMQYRGVFIPGEYERGDVVTWGGSAWHCVSKTSDKPGEPGSSGWILMVKKGRDGKAAPVSVAPDNSKGVKL